MPFEWRFAAADDGPLLDLYLAIPQLLHLPATLMSFSMKLNLLFSKFAGSLFYRRIHLPVFIYMYVLFGIPYYYPDVFMRHSIDTSMVL